MRIFNSITDPELVTIINDGAIGVLPTDTLYGLVASTAHPDAIERIYQVRQRAPLKGCITLLADSRQADSHVVWDDFRQKVADKYWPGPVSIVLPVRDDVPAHLHPIDGTLAYRVPRDQNLRTLLGQVGPLFAPSANPAGEVPAGTIQQAMSYFGDSVDFYVDMGDLSANDPSVLIRPNDGQVEVLRGQLVD